MGYQTLLFNIFNNTITINAIKHHYLRFSLMLLHPQLYILRERHNVQKKTARDFL